MKEGQISHPRKSDGVFHISGLGTMMIPLTEGREERKEHPDSILAKRQGVQFLDAREEPKGFEQGSLGHICLGGRAEEDGGQECRRRVLGTRQ